jgi:hypothetical protein
MKNKLRILAVALVAGGTMFAQPRISVGIGVGGYGPGYYPPSAYSQYVPPCPGPDYVWSDGYWHRPFVSGYRVAPRFIEPRNYSSFRGSDRGFDNRFQNRGGERHDNRANRGRGYSNSFRR